MRNKLIFYFFPHPRIAGRIHGWLLSAIGRTMIRLFGLLILFPPTLLRGQEIRLPELSHCPFSGSCTLYDYQQKKFLCSDPADADMASLPASTFKIPNLLIALETGVIRDAQEVIRWPGQTDTTLYGYRPEIYHDMTAREAFESSAVWAFLEMAGKVGRDRYHDYLIRCNYGNADTSYPGEDFWNLGPLAISPKGQIRFLVALYEEKLPFSARNMRTVKETMITERGNDYTIHAKTGWTRLNGLDTGWWVGYVEKAEGVWFFATRLSKPRSVINPDFGPCRKELTKSVLKGLGILK
ncbi:MAG: penicillin binding protein transpeptidase domain-containing protein [Marinilabiliales bacterium]|nr:penicillin binding protein transpeptidase domain-containing protein [Marinilabiliales bacterium]